MNILYISHLGGELYAGPTYSVPKQIEAQSKLDNVFWYNAVKKEIAEWKKLSFYHDLNEYPDESIYKLPKPFNLPDIVVVELFYNMTLSKFRKELVHGEIPYIIIPRGELTKQAQKRKWLKKQIANIVYMRKFSRKAKAIQYLTNQEYLDSGDKWNKNHIIIPNGIDLPSRQKEHFSNNGVKCVFIGRIEPYHKGLDLLIETCKQIRQQLLDKKCKVKIYGPDIENKSGLLIQEINNNGLDNIVSVHDGIYGEEKEEILLESDVFLIPSRFEGHPMTLIEALSYGLPAIATSGSNMKDEIDEYQAGWTAQCSVESLEKAFLAMLKTNYNEMKEFENNALKLAKKYDWNNIAIQTHNTYQNILKKD